MNLSGQITAMRITRHFVQIGSRRVHYGRCGKGPVLLMAHQSPRSSAEYEPLMRQWGAHFTCIAPDTPGFGQSDPLPAVKTDIGDFAAALIETLDALGLGRVAAYGFHSGGIILAATAKRYPDRFHGLAIGGYAVWTPEEMRVFGESYLPAFVPQPYGEHLTWLWNRVLEQSWFFPWFDVRDATRLSVAHDVPERVHATVMDMLAAGDAYRAGYGAVLRAPRDMPQGNDGPPVLITAYDGDPLQDHIDRLGRLPANWQARKVRTAAEHQAASLDFLTTLPGADAPPVREVSDEGFLPVVTDRFDGLIHWRGDQSDPPGFGLSDDWKDAAPTDWAPWQAVLDAMGRPVTPQAPAAGDPDRLYPDLTPDRFGAYLTRAWSVARAEALFRPWYQVDAAHSIPVDRARLQPESLARRHLEILRARAARAYHIAYNGRK